MQPIYTKKKNFFLDKVIVLLSIFFVFIFSIHSSAQIFITDSTSFVVTEGTKVSGIDLSSKKVKFTNQKKKTDSTKLYIVGDTKVSGKISAEIVYVDSKNLPEKNKKIYEHRNEVKKIIEQVKIAKASPKREKLKREEITTHQSIYEFRLRNLKRESTALTFDATLLATFFSFNYHDGYAVVNQTFDYEFTLTLFPNEKQLNNTFFLDIVEDSYDSILQLRGPPSLVL